MKIDRLHISDFRGIEELTLEFEGKSAILFGINGAGKSSVLWAINLLYAPIINKIVKQRFKQNINLELKDIRTGKASADLEALFLLESEGEARPLPFRRNITCENRRDMDSAQLERLVAAYEDLYVGGFHVDGANRPVYENSDFDLPVFANYGVNRLVLKTPLRFRRKPSFGQYSAFDRAIENQIAFDSLFEWFFDQEFYENLKQKDDPGYQDKALCAVKRAMLAMLPDCADIHIVARPYSMRIMKQGENLDILQLSDGEKCTLALFGDIARRLAIANPSLENPLEGKGVVLIDEMELHMHTSWQRTVVPALRRTFPNLQFIITTHSPQILGEAGDDFKVFSMERTRDTIQVQELFSLYGMDSNAILEDMMGTDALSPLIKNTADEMYQWIEKGNYEKAELLADRIDTWTRGRNADTVRARIMIRRGKARNAQNCKTERTGTS